jgi:prolyl-tRNA synthetase
MGVIAEKLSDEKGLVWPEAIAPYKVYLVSIGNVSEQATELYEQLQQAGVTVLFDDRDERPGAKFADAELIGLPYRITISERLIAEGKLEFSRRNGGEVELLTLEECLAKIA